MVSPFILMPIAYQRDDQRRLITVTVTEPCSVDDIASVIDRQGEGTWKYALLYDLRAATDASTEADLQQLAERVKVAGREGERGPVGVAIRARPALFVLALMYTRMMTEFATAEVLLTAAQIDAWLVRNAPGGSARRQ
jgi:ribosomal protein S28E/S33